VRNAVVLLLFAALSLAAQAQTVPQSQNPPKPQSELLKQDLTTLQSHDAEIERLTLEIESLTAFYELRAHKKWCHQTLWRRLRGYREPAWCYR
jgi:hypothetical protein